MSGCAHMNSKDTCASCRPTDPLRAKIAEIRLRHRTRWVDKGGSQSALLCDTCVVLWPCDATLALDALEHVLAMLALEQPDPEDMAQILAKLEGRNE